MHATTEQFQAIRREAWVQDHADAMECRRTEELIDRVTGLWDADRQFFAGVVPGAADRDAARAVATTLRTAEQAMTALAERATGSIAKGYTVDNVGRLVAALAEARELLLRPMARRMADRDPDGRSADAIAHLLLRRVRFEDGRPVVTEDAVADLPSPFDPERIAWN